MYRAYETELFRFDQLYRHFCEAADLAEAARLEHPQAAAGRRRGVLRQLVSDRRWPWPGASSSSRTAGCSASGRSRRCRTSTASTTATCGPGWRKATTARAFVIISDAFRYEAAQELAAELNGKYRFEADADLAAWRAAIVHRPGHGEPAAAQDAGVQGRHSDVLVDGKSSVGRRAGRRSCKPSAVWRARPTN